METNDESGTAEEGIRGSGEEPKEAEGFILLNQLLDKMIGLKSLSHMKTSIDFMTNTLDKEKQYLFEIKDFYHYFCVITETAIEEQYLRSVADNLKAFFEKIIDVCYQWKCLSDSFENDFRLFNCVQHILQSIITKLNDISVDNDLTDQCIPLMLISMIVIVSTIHGLKEVVLISRPITREIVIRRKTNSLSVCSEEWKRLISCLANVCNIWQQINDIDSTDGHNLAKFLVRLVDLSLGSDPFLSHIAAKAIKCLSREKSLPLDELFIEYQVEISSHILLLLNIGSHFDNLGQLLHKTMSLFGVNSLPRELLRHILPHFAIRCDETTKRFIREIAKIDEKRESEVIKIYFNDIIRQMFYSKTFHKKFENYVKVIEFLSRVSNFDIRYRMGIVSYDLINSLLLLLSKDKDSTLEAIAFVHFYRSTTDGSNINLNVFKENESVLRCTLNEYFLAFVHKFDALMQDYSVSNREKMTATQSFVQLVPFMGNECINTFRVKIFSTIKLILSERFYSNPNIIKSSIEAMMQFIKMIDESYLSSQLLTISALMLPLMHYWPTETSYVFKALIIEHQSIPSFQSAFKHLYFIPEIKELIEVTQVLKPYITYSENKEEENISLVVNNINHENSRVQEFSLRELKKLLTRHQSLIYKKCNNIKEFHYLSHNFINEIVTKLMLCLKSTNKNVLLLVAECLGVLGAIDPLRIDLDKPVISKEEKSEKFLNANDDEFKRVLISLLYKAITTATKTDDQYCASYALQEILRQFTRDGFKIDDLGQQMRDYCAVLQKTRYNATNRLTKSSEVTTEPIFGSSLELSYKEWLNRWLTVLFQSYIFGKEKDETNELNSLLSQPLSGPLPSQRSQGFEQELAETLAKYSIKSKVLSVCFLALLRSQSVAQFLLPYVVITALKNANLEQKQFILAEVKSIITKLTTDESIFNGQIGHLSSQTVFHLYDYLKVWHKKRISLHQKICKTNRHLKTAQMKDKEYKGVNYFLGNISNKELSVLAHKCNAYSRSLRYLEDYVKTFSGNSFQEEIPFFQKIFIRLEEPDSVEGCNNKRTRSPNINERILTHEALGQIQEALVCCAKAVELNPNDFESHRKFLQISNDRFDQSELVCNYGTGLMMKRPEWRRKLAPYVIEAVWKLGDWDQLEQLLKENENSFATFGSGTGDLFCSIIKKKGLNELEDKLTHLRNTLVGPLSAAAMEISGYVRGHKYVVDLHVLNDIQLIYDKVMTKLDEEVICAQTLQNKFLKVVKTWDQRNDLVRKSLECQEPILNSQRALLGILANRANCAELSSLIKKELFKSWLMSTKTSRKSGNIQRSYNCLLQMNKMRESLSLNFGDGQEFMSSVSTLTNIENSEAIVETAKVQWITDNRIAAIQYLKNQIEQNFMSSHNECTDKAINQLNDGFSSDEILDIRKSLSFGSSALSTCLSSIASYQSSTITSTESTGSNALAGEDGFDEAFAKLQLLYTKYCDRSGVLNQDTLAILYKSVTIAAPHWEESHYSLGMYCYKLYTSHEDSRRSSKQLSMGKPEEILDNKGRAVRALVQSLKYGVKHAHISLPLLFNIWFDLGTDLYNQSNRSRSSSASSQLCEEIRRRVTRINDAINDLLANVPIYVFFISFAQFTARVLHPNQLISATLKKVIIRLIIHFPDQSMWLLLRSHNSYNLSRSNCFREIVNKAVSDDPTGRLKKFIPDILKFTKMLAQMCEKNPDSSQRTRQPGQPTRVKQLSFRKDFPELWKLFARTSDFSPILLPFRSLVSVTLPKSMHSENYNPFPSKEIYINGFDDCIECLHSLQKPKKIKINGSDGQSYTILCKPGDDLRKDYCLIEFSNLLNRCFKRDSEARRRQLRVKNYLVIPLNDKCGLIEWIPGLMPLRAIVENQYRVTKDYDAIKETVIRNYPMHKMPKPERVRRFQREILPKFEPPVFSNWFTSTYTDPLSWFAARLAYIRSSAVFSIIGYLLGLGDRHGENILIEEVSGETVHVDLNCMFNKGEEFQVPERVPFRLTHNMINAMGVTEFEGTFRKACEHALRVARDNKDALMNFVTPFRYDLLKEWPKNDFDVRHSSETQNKYADRIVANIEARLNGISLRSTKNLPKGLSLSVEGQVDHIIKEATDINNLGLMYVGWTPYL